MRLKFLTDSTEAPGIFFGGPSVKSSTPRWNPALRVGLKKTNLNETGAGTRESGLQIEGLHFEWQISSELEYRDHWEIDLSVAEAQSFRVLQAWVEVWNVSIRDLCAGGETAATILGPHQTDVESGLITLYEAPRLAYGGKDNFVDRAMRLERDGHNDASLDLIYDSVDDLLNDGSYALCASILNDVDVRAGSTDILLGLLTATLPAKSHIPTRLTFVRRVEKQLRNRGENEDELLTGLR